jgi:RHS repeat-associated protein
MRSSTVIVTLLASMCAVVSSEAHAAFGRTDGAFGVSAEGASTYSVPIWLPPGPRGVAPSLALTYSSLNGNGPLGVGWGLAGLSAIERCPRVDLQNGGTTQVRMVQTDEYCLGLNRLMLLTGSQGSQNSTYALDVADFSVVTAAAALQGLGPESFTMVTKGGLIYEYGTAADARVAFGPSATVLRWLLKKVRDRDGNSYAVSYTVSDGVAVPSSISWSPTAPNGTSYRYSVVFTWQDKADPKDWTASYIATNQLLSKKRLSSISVRQGSTTVRKYALAYESGVLTKFSRLTSIKECSDEAETDCLPPTTMAYQQGQTITATTAASVGITSGATIHGAADFNGDGKDDLVYAAGSDWYVLFGSNGGFGSPVRVNGMTGMFGRDVDYDNFLPGRRAAFIALINGTLYSFSANDSGTAFTQASTGLTFPPLSKVPTGIASSGSELAQLVWVDSPVTLTNNIVMASSNITPAGATTPSFATPNTRHTIPLTATINGTTYTVMRGATHFISDRGLERRDFDGNGWPELYAALTLRFCQPPESTNCSPQLFTYVALLSQGGLAIAPAQQWVEYTGVYALAQAIRFNDDDCSDAAGVVLADCAGALSTSISQPATGFWLDWDGDGRSDLATNSGGNIAIRHSTGTGLASAITTTVPYYDDYRVLDLDGDGLDDIARVEGTIVRYYTRTPAPTVYLAQYPDLLASVTDGHGVSHSVDYASTAHSNYLVGDFVAGLATASKRIVVARATSPDGIGGTYTRSYTYAGGREDPFRGTFTGFQQRHETDSSTGLLTKAYYRQTFPLVGWQWKTEVLRNSGTQLVQRNEITERVESLSSNVFRPRYFPFVEVVASDIYEPEGTASLVKREHTTFSNHDLTTGNVGTITTVLEAGGGSDRWQSTTTLQYEPQTSGCLDLLREVKVDLDRIAPDRPVVSRTVRFTKDGGFCRHKTQVVQPDSPRHVVTTTFGYDGFGNVSATQADALEPSLANPNVYQAMPSRTTSLYWGSAGTAPESITNPLNQSSTADYYATTGLLRSLTDPNGLPTSIQYDGFGRPTRVTRPDGTYTTWTYEDCASSSGCVSGTQHRTTVVQQELDVNGGEIRRQYTYLDRFDRVLVSRTSLLSGNYQWREMRYDSLGNLVRSGIACLTSQPTTSCVAAWTEFAQYDLFGRPKRVEQPANEQELTRELVTTLAYSGLTTTATDPLGRTTSKLVDVNGHVRRATDANGYFQEFSYDSVGSLIEVREQPQSGRDALLFSAQYDYGLGAFQVASNERALGARTRWFDGFGQLRRWTDAKGQGFFADYDALSRLVSEVSPDAARSWVWGNSLADYNIGQLFSQSSTTGGETYSEQFYYDSSGRLRQQRILLPGETANPYVYDFTYQANTGQLDTLRYPTSTAGYRLGLKYNVTGGTLTSIADADSPSTVYWSLDSAAGGLNALGQIEDDALGPIVRRRSFDGVTGGLEQITAGPSGSQTSLQNASVNYDDFGNVFQRQNNLGTLPSALTENFDYGEPGVDQLDRLTRIELGNGAGVETRDYRYDLFGNIELITASGTATPADLVPVDLSITWTSDNYPRTINAAWLSESASFAYGADRQRWRMVYQQGAASETTYYLGLMEKVVTAAGTEYRHHIPGPEEIIALYTRASSGSNALRYVLTDHLGSIDTIASSAGAALVRASYGAHGMPRDPLDWSGAPSGTAEDITRQGFTYQTVLGRMGLNHMNGRVQDAISGTFISPDPYVPDAMNTQAFNRYAYVYNNPLTYTDPSGFKPSPDDWPCQPFDLFGCGGFIPWWVLQPGTADDDFLACFARGGCRGTRFAHNYNPKVAPQTAIVQMDKRPVAKTRSASEGPSLVRVAASVGVGFIPVLGSVQSVVELISGRDYITGEKTSRAWAAVGIVAGLVGLKGVLKAATKADDIVDGARRLANRTCCFVAGTLVATDRGLRQIEEIEIGDLVLSRDEYTGETAYKPVTNVIRRHDREVWDVSFAIRQDGEITTARFETTDDHPWRTTDGRWLKTLELAPGNEIQRAEGVPAKIVSVVRTKRIAPTFNLQVAGFESYFVGEARVWVHNCTLFSVDDLSRAAGAADRGGFTAAGRSLTKHGSGARPGNTKFPAPKGNPAAINQMAQDVVDDILTTPGVTFARSHRGRFGATIEVTAPDGRGIVYDATGKFLFFKE